MKFLDDNQPLVEQLRDLAQRRRQDADRLFAIALQIEQALKDFRALQSPGNLRLLISIHARGTRVFEDVAKHPPEPTEPPIQRIAMAA